MAAFTRDAEETIAKYVQDGPLVDIIEVRTVDATLEELKRAQRDAGSIVRGLGFQAASGTNVFENRAEIYVHDLAGVEDALEESGKTLPAHVRPHLRDGTRQLGPDLRTNHKGPFARITYPA